MEKVKIWIARYLPSEIAGTITAIIAGTVTHYFFHNNVVTAFAGVWGENIGFYGTIFTRDLWHSMQVHKFNKIHYGLIAFFRDMRNLLLEFGPSELLDSFVVRPFMMYLFPNILKNVSLGILIGKLFADGTFYLITIVSYELTRRHLK